MVSNFIYAAEVAAPQQPDSEKVTVTEIHTEEIAAVEKMTELPGFLTVDKKMIDSIGVETLSEIATPLIAHGSIAPAMAKVKLGIIASCDCAKLKLYRIPSDPTQKPIQISYDAIRGFSADNKTVEVILEVMADSRLKLKVVTPAELAPGKILEWMPANEMKVVEVSIDKNNININNGRYDSYAELYDLNGKKILFKHLMNDEQINFIDQYSCFVGLVRKSTANDLLKLGRYHYMSVR